MRSFLLPMIGWRSLLVDPRQVLAGFLTLSMFAMLGNMIKRDHFDTIEVKVQELSNVKFDVLKLEERAANQVSRVSRGPWKENGQVLKPCWMTLEPKGEQAKGFVTLSLTSGPEYHMSQIADAVVVARYLGATLVLPDIRGSEVGKKRNFSDMYDADKFIQSLSGVVKIAGELPPDVASGKPEVIRVPNRITKDFITKHIEPVFSTNNYLRIASSFPSTNLKLKNSDRDFDSIACLAMYRSLELKQEIAEVADRMVDRLRTLSRDMDSHFIAVDLTVDALEKKSCKVQKGKGRKSCYNAQEIADFLTMAGFSGDSTIYLTQSWWHESLNPLKQAFRKTYTKDDIIPVENKALYLRSGSSELERALDFRICSKSDVFVPAISGLFYGNVVGKRIANGKTQILVPSQAPDASAEASGLISTYVSKKNHLAYSCYCRVY